MRLSMIGLLICMISFWLFEFYPLHPLYTFGARIFWVGAVFVVSGVILDFLKEYREKVTKNKSEQ